MTTVHMVCGPSGAGKTTCARRLARERNALLFSIDPWMHTLFAPDAPVPLRVDWMMDRLARCEAQLWSVAAQALGLGIEVVLDLGFMTREQRAEHRRRAEATGAQVSTVFLDAPPETRWARVQQRNRERDPKLFVFEVTRAMFDFMEPRFEAPDPEELDARDLLDLG